MITPPTPQYYVITELEKMGWVCETKQLDPPRSAYNDCLGSGGYCGRYWPEDVILRRGYATILVTHSEVFIDESSNFPEEFRDMMLHDSERMPHARSSQMSIRAAQHLLFAVKNRYSIGSIVPTTPDKPVIITSLPGS